MAWKMLKMTEDLSKAVMSTLTSEYERYAKTKRVISPFEDYLANVIGLRETNRWSATENSLKSGRLVAIHGLGDELSILFVHDPSGKLVGSFSEHHGQDRGPNRRIRVARLLGERAAKVLL